MPTIMPKLTPPNPSPVAANPTRSRSGGAAGSSFGDATASPFPLELNRARKRTAEPESEHATDRAASSKRSSKAETAKKAKASRKANDEAQETESVEGKSVKGKAAKPADDAEAVGEDAEVDSADAEAAAAADDTADANEVIDPEAVTAVDATAVAATIAVSPSQQAESATGESDPEAADGEVPDAEAVAGLMGAPATSATAVAPVSSADAEDGEETDAQPQDAVVALKDAKAAAVDGRDDVEAATEEPASQSGVKVAKAKNAEVLDATATEPGAPGAPQAGVSAEASPVNRSDASGASEMNRMVDALGRQLAAAGETAGPTQGATGPTAGPTAQAPLPPEARFAEANHANLVTSMRSELMPNGGTMRIRLDPPQLGALQVTVHMRDGVMTASFETSSDEATKLLSHSLAQLKGVLESQGVSVEKLQVQQGPREAQATGRNDNQQQEQPGGQQQREATREEQQEHQRKEMMRRMWRRLSGAADPLDVTG